MGRAPTSGNCHTCRQRRVKCDKERPACQRCLKAGYECQGYETVLRIQSHAVVAGAAPGTSRLAKIQAVSSFPAGPPDDAPPARGARRYVRRTKTLVKSPPSDEGYYSLSPAEIGSSDSARQSHASSPERSLSPPPELSLVAFVDDMSFSYFFQSYGWINMHSIMLQDSAMRTHLAGEGMAHDSLRALTYGLLGRDLRIANLQHSGRLLYGKTLQTLRSNLTTASKEELALMVKPIAIMGSYSITIDNDLRFTHHRGLARILEHCGPEYFQSPSLLPIFESARLTLISSSIVRREATFLAKPEWRTVPWELAPYSKSSTSKLLDILAEVPSIIQDVWTVMGGRLNWLVSGCKRPSTEPPSAVPELQARVSAVVTQLASWRMEWEFENPLTVPHIMAWAFRRAQDDVYRPGIGGVQGPDIYDSNIMTDLYGWAQPSQPQSDSLIFAHMQDIALYTTVIIWTTRLAKYLNGAVKDPTNIDFFTDPFYTSCSCCSIPPKRCETIPMRVRGSPIALATAVDPAMTWNVSAAKMAVAPMKMMPGLSPSSSSPASNGSSTAPPNGNTLDANDTSLSSSMPLFLDSESVFKPSVLLPADVRFASQLRILSWLVDRLPDSRGHVLGTLAAIGLGHCGHDVRPAKGVQEVAVTVNRVLDSTRFEGASDILLKSYQPMDSPPV